jgi:dTDP-4-dehydrorhamnose 3,5-epimerase
MNITSTSISSILILEPRVFADERGFFMETYQAKKFAELGIPDHFVQDNQSGSRRGVLRGLHYQVLNPQGKLVRCVAGMIFDVAVDLRRQFAHLWRWVGTILSSENRRQLWIPVGSRTGFTTLSDWAEVDLLSQRLLQPQVSAACCGNDPQVGIQWAGCRPGESRYYLAQRPARPAAGTGRDFQITSHG